MTRWRASALHLLISVALAASVLIVMLLVWYPGPLFVAGGGSRLLVILTGVDVSIGPLITLAVYRQGKPGMTFDLVIIAILQLCAFGYGLHVVYNARPAFIVFAKDQFQIASAADIAPKDFAAAKSPQFRHAPLFGPLWAYAQMPTDPKDRDRIITAAMAGKDLESFPRLYRPYLDHAKDVLAHALTLTALQKSDPAAARIVNRYMSHSGLKDDDVRYLRMRARQAWVAVLVDARTARPVKMLITERD